MGPKRYSLCLDRSIDSASCVYLLLPSRMPPPFQTFLMRSKCESVDEYCTDHSCGDDSF